MDDTIKNTYTRSSRRLFLLDYDGTLVDFHAMPSGATPTELLRNTLETLGSDPKNTVVIISGRDHNTLQSWLGDLPVSFVAEHGYLVRDSGSEWETTFANIPDWKKTIRPIMENAVTKVPKSFIEEKASALVWHYRQAAPQTVDQVTDDLKRDLRHAAKEYGLTVMPGNKILEVKVAGIDKGKAAERWLRRNAWDFVLAAGDDTTDEDLFAAMPVEAYTVKIGHGATAAKSRVPDPYTFIKFLDGLQETAQE